MKTLKRLTALALTLCMVLSVLCIGASAKTIPAGQTVGTVLFYVENSKGEEILVSHITVEEMGADLEKGLINNTVYNFSVLDRYVTTVHQEAQGFSVSEFIDYAKNKSTLQSLRELNLTFMGKDQIAFWEIDQTEFDGSDTYSYDDLYGVARYNFPLLYEYWDYGTQDYYDPNGVMTRDEVIDYIFEHGEPATFLLGVREFSQRYMLTESKFGTGDYNLENYWDNNNLLDSERSMRMLKPMTEAELRMKTPTASDTRYWVSNIMLNMEKDPDVASLGQVAAPTATMTEAADNYYIKFECATPDATILYNHNYISPSYAPSSEYTGGWVAIPKSWFPNGTVTMTCRAVKDGYTDLGVQTLTLTSSGAYEGETWENPFADVSTGDWYYNAVGYVAGEGLFNGTSATTFTPEGTMTRAMFATVLHRYFGTPAPTAAAPFTDIPAGTWYSDAVAWAYEQGHMNGTGNSEFSPVGDISLEQMLLVLYRCAGSPSANGSAPASLGTVSFWAASAVGWAAGAGLLDGVGGTLTAQGAATRAQVAAILQNFSQI